MSVLLQSGWSCRFVVAAMLVAAGEWGGACAQGANLFVNGSLTGPVNTHSLVPSGWANMPGSGTTDTMSAAGHPFGPEYPQIGEFPYANSVDAGTFAWSADYFMTGPDPEGLRQTVSGLSIGQQYRITLEYTNLGLYDDTGNIALNAFGAGHRHNSAGRWQILGNGVLLEATPSVDFTQTFGMQVWRPHSMTYVATTTTVEFGFVAEWVSGAGTHIGMGIDGIGLDVLPAPGTGMAVCVGVIAAARRRR